MLTSFKGGGFVRLDPSGPPVRLGERNAEGKLARGLGQIFFAFDGEAGGSQVAVFEAKRAGEDPRRDLGRPGKDGEGRAFLFCWTRSSLAVTGLEGSRTAETEYRRESQRTRQWLYRCPLRC